MGWETYDPYPPEKPGWYWLILVALSIAATALLWTLG
jgi:hypothetical protein